MSTPYNVIHLERTRDVIESLVAGTQDDNSTADEIIRRCNVANAIRIMVTMLREARGEPDAS